MIEVYTAYVCKTIPVLLSKEDYPAVPTYNIIFLSTSSSIKSQLCLVQLLEIDIK